MSKTINFQLDQGSTFTRDFRAQNDDGTLIDITGLTIEAKMMNLWNPYVTWSFDPTITDGPSGSFTLSMPSERSATIPAETLLYTVVLIDSQGTRRRIIEGQIGVKPSLTAENPFQNYQGIRIYDPRIIHLHENKDLLDQITEARLLQSYNKIVAYNGTVTGTQEITDGSRSLIMMLDSTDFDLTITDSVDEGYSFELLFSMSPNSVNIPIKDSDNNTLATIHTLGGSVRVQGVFMKFPADYLSDQGLPQSYEQPTLVLFASDMYPPTSIQ